MFAIVEFSGSNEVAVVPVEWICEGKGFCWWPNFKTLTKLSDAVKSKIMPDPKIFTKYPLLRVMKSYRKFVIYSIILSFNWVASSM